MMSFSPIITSNVILICLITGIFPKWTAWEN